MLGETISQLQVPQQSHHMDIWYVCLEKLSVNCKGLNNHIIWIFGTYAWRNYQSIARASTITSYGYSVRMLGETISQLQGPQQSHHMDIRYVCLEKLSLNCKGLNNHIIWIFGTYAWRNYQSIASASTIISKCNKTCDQRQRFKHLIP